MATISGRSAVALLLRRTGFSATGAAIDAATAAGYGPTVDAVLASCAPGADQAADAVALPDLAIPAPPGKDAPAEARQAHQQALKRQGDALVEWWVRRMIVAQCPAAEKLCWFWHSHFATSIDKVKVAAMMQRQNGIFRQHGLGDFTALVSAVAQDPAMLVWLDTATSVAAHPNENFARELMELFTLGIGTYGESDVKEAARSFTGWAFDRASLAFAERPRQHDAGAKTILGHTGNFDGLDTIALLTGTAACAHFLAARLWSRFAAPAAPTDPVAGELAAAWAGGRQVDTLLRAVVTHPAFLTDAVAQGLVKQPVEWVVGAVRALGLAPDVAVAAESDVATAAVRALAALGQTPFRPPSVGGWPAQGAWLNTAAEQVKLSFATTIARAALDSAAGHELTATKESDRPPHLAWMLGLDGWWPSTADALASVAADPAMLVVLGLTSPEWALA
jgi:uncharacterized protein (DUF1800 family)